MPLGLGMHPFDVVMFHDGVLRGDDVAAESLAQYERVILPEVISLAAGQTELRLLACPAAGREHHRLFGELGGEGDVASDPRSRADHPGRLDRCARTWCPARRRSWWSPGMARGAANLQRAPMRWRPLHVINYDYDDELEQTVRATGVGVNLQVPFAATTARVRALGAEGR